MQLRASRLNAKSLVRAIGALAVVCVLGVYGLRCTQDAPIHSDGIGYYAYLPAIVVDHDLSMRGIVARGIVEFGSIRPYGSSAANLDKYPAGVAVMMSPFFLTAHVIARLAGLRADGFSPIYQVFAALSGLVYGWLGLVVLRRMLEQRFDQRVTMWTLVGVVFGTNLFHYFTWESIYSHAYSFFLLAILVEAVPRWHARPTFGRSLALGMVAGLVLLVRPTNACALLFVPLYGFDGGGRWLGRFPQLALIALSAATVFSLQLFYWHHVSRHWIVYSYQGEAFAPLSPKPLHVLVSFKKGLFVWAPILVLSMIGLWRARRDRLRAEFVPIVVVLVAQLWIVSSWWCWWYGVSLGHRAFTEFVPLFALGLGAFLERGFAAAPAARVRAERVYMACVGYGVLMTVLYWTGILPFAGPDWGPLL
jgi:hypothetical protein